MKLLYITNQICGSGGLERVLSIKASYFANELDYEVHIITLNQHQKDNFYNFSPKISIHNINLPKGNPIAYIKNYLRSINQKLYLLNPDISIVCDDGVKGHLLPYFLKTKNPVILERHASNALHVIKESSSLAGKLKWRIQNGLINQGARKFDAVILLTKGNIKEWKSKVNLVVIPNPLPFFPGKLSLLENKVVISVGNHGYHKGFDRLLLAWQKVSIQNPDWSLKIYGKIDREERHINLARDLGLKNVEFHSPVRDIGSKYQEASIYALPSRTEGFGMVLIEAMSYGVPCVAFDCPTGPRDIIEEGANGFLVNDGDTELFADRIVRLIKHRELRNTLGRAGRIKSEDYLMKNIGQKWTSLFDQLLKDKG